MLDLGLFNTLVAFDEVINGDSVIAMVRPMFIVISVSIYLLLNGIFLDLSSLARALCVLTDPDDPDLVSSA